jgi:two-component system, response regulator RpfG
MTVLLDQLKDYSMISNVMIIDDQITSRIILETIVQGIGDNIQVSTYDNAISALDVIASNPPDLIITDYKMPELNGVEFTRRLRNIPACSDIPVIIITIIEEKAVMYEALEAGATDFLTKPVDNYECKVRCRNLLTMRRQQIIIKNRAHSLENKVREATEQIHIREKETLLRLARAGEFKDGDTGLHLTRMAKISRHIAEEIGMDSIFCDT